jgi:hypothetical protein
VHLTVRTLKNSKSSKNAFKQFHDALQKVCKTSLGRGSSVKVCPNGYIGNGPFFFAEFEQPYWSTLVSHLQKEKKENHQVFPPEELIFNAFNLCPLSKVKVVLLGQGNLPSTYFGRENLPQIINI